MDFLLYIHNLSHVPNSKKHIIPFLIPGHASFLVVEWRFIVNIPNFFAKFVGLKTKFV